MTLDQILELVETWSPAVFCIVGVVLIWLILEFIVTLHKLRSTVKDLKEDIEPTLAHVDTLTAQLEPVLAKADPLIERLSLTVDAANLEIMRLDGILEDVNEITGSLTSAGDALDKVTKAPTKLVSSTVDQVRSVFKSPKASPESVRLGMGEPAEFPLPLPGDEAAESPENLGESASAASGKGYISYNLDPVSQKDAEPEPAIELEEPVDPEPIEELAEPVEPEAAEEIAEVAEPELIEA